MFDVRFDPARRVLHLRLEGFWSMATIDHFAAEMAPKATAFRLRHGSFATLSDARAFWIQSADVLERFERFRARATETKAGPTAIVVASALSKTQAERVLKSDRVRVFLDLAEAEAWLAAEWAPWRAAAA